MRIALNLLPLIPGEVGGVETFTANLLAALAKFGECHDYIAYATPEAAGCVPRRPNFRVVNVRIPARLRPFRVVWEQLWLPARLHRDRIDVAHSFANAPLLLTRRSQVVTVYDIRFEFFPEQFTLYKRLYRGLMVRQTVRMASRILVISRFTRDTLIERLGAKPIQIVVTYIPVENHFQPLAPEQVEAFRGNMKLPTKFMLYVSNTYPNKNHVGLLRAFDMARRTGGFKHKLVLRGEPGPAEGEVQATVRELGLGSDVIRIPRLPRQDLPLLYSAADALVYPSVFEGFGIPVLEAMACGCPVVASNVTALSEVVDGAGILIDPLDVSSLANSMCRIASNAELRAHLSHKGLQRSANFSLEKMAEQTQTAYLEAVSCGS